MDLNQNQTIVMALGLLVFSFCLKNTKEIRNLGKRTDLLIHHGKEIFLDTDTINKHYEKLHTTFNITKLNDLIKEQIKLFIKAYTDDELLILKNNLENLTIDENYVSLFNGGCYNPLKNAISINTLYDKNSSRYLYALSHELHHMASNLGRIDKYLIGGFRQTKIENGILHIGTGLDEAYTEYLNKSLFNEKEYIYKKLVDLIPLFELFYDNKSELRRSYFNADLPSVIHHFDEISSAQEIIKLIRDIDKLWVYNLYNTWFDKSEELEINIRTKLYELYKMYSGYQDREELFFDSDMLEKSYVKTKIRK